MMKRLSIAIGCLFAIFVSVLNAAEPVKRPKAAPAAAEIPIAAPLPAASVSAGTEYCIGVDDVLEIAILQPDKMALTVTVSPDGSITFPYIGNVQVKGRALSSVQNEIQSRLAEGYLKYPVASVTLKESRSKKFFVYGEVARPGTYMLNENTTVLKAISIAGGLSKYGSASRVKILRPKKNESGYEAIKVNINAVMNGSSKDDILLRPEDMLVATEGIF